VLVRLSGEVRAFDDRCPHRLAPLHLGRVEGGTTLRCGYHGWAYDGDGRCTEIPSSGPAAAIPARACLARPWGVAERYGLVWVAPEEPSVDLPTFPEWEQPGFTSFRNEPRTTRAGAFPLADNFLDAAHFPFVHRSTFGVDAALPPYSVVADGASVAATCQAPYRLDGVVHQQLVTKVGWPPATAYVKVHLPATGAVLSILFCCTPVDGGRTRIFKQMAANDLVDAGAVKAAIAFEDRVLDEDLRILEAYPETSLPLDLGVEVHAPADRLSVAYRRLLTGWLAIPDTGPG
jgi:vanillate O-demethylase monooxygenase subunit